MGLKASCHSSSSLGVPGKPVERPASGNRGTAAPPPRGGPAAGVTGTGPDRAQPRASARGGGGLGWHRTGGPQLFGVVIFVCLFVVKSIHTAKPQVPAGARAALRLPRRDDRAVLLVPLLDSEDANSPGTGRAPPTPCSPARGRSARTGAAPGCSGGTPPRSGRRWPARTASATARCT